MKLKNYFLFTFLVAISSNLLGQQTGRPLYQVIIFKRINDDNKIINTLIRIDSTGKIYKQHQKIESSFDIKLFAKEVNDYIIKEKIDKYEADNDPPREAPMPELNKQATIVTVWFQDDVNKEKSFANKTNYSWGKSLNKNDTEYLLFRYLSTNEIEILKKLLE
jgi:hypothetical protein